MDLIVVVLVPVVVATAFQVDPVVFRLEVSVKIPLHTRAWGSHRQIVREVVVLHSVDVNTTAISSSSIIGYTHRSVGQRGRHEVPVVQQLVAVIVVGVLAVVGVVEGDTHRGVDGIVLRLISL